MDPTSLSKEMLTCFLKLNTEEQQSVISMIKTFINGRVTEYGPITLDEYNSELEEADREIENGDFIYHDEVKEKYLK